MTLAKEPSVTDIYNDIGFVACFFRVLRDETKAAELIRRLTLTPWSREEGQFCYDHWKEETEDIEKARQWFTLISQNFTHEEGRYSWLVEWGGKSAANAWANHVDDLGRVAERFRRIYVENLSFELVIELYDHSDTLFYCDPPYFGEGRTSQASYAHEMPRRKHILLLEMLQHIKGQAIVSGYPSELYSSYLKDWRLVRVERKSAIHNKAQMADAGTKVECIWIKEHQNGLWTSQGRTSTNVPSVHTQENHRSQLRGARRTSNI